tara:strand:+ start:141 stop:1145 length:1005 start_codon:yes stop_codon:yes gene_type:complete
MAIVHFKRRKFPDFFASVDSTSESCLSANNANNYESVLQGKTGPQGSCPCCHGHRDLPRFEGVVKDSRQHVLGPKRFYVCEKFIEATCEPGAVAALALSRLATYNVSPTNGEFGAQFGRFRELEEQTDWDENVFPLKKRRRFLCCDCRDTIATAMVKTGYGKQWNAYQPFCAFCVYKQDRLRKALQAFSAGHEPNYSCREAMAAKFCAEAEKVWTRNFEPLPPKPDTSHHYKVGGYRVAYPGIKPEHVIEMVAREHLAYSKGDRFRWAWLHGTTPPRVNGFTGEILDFGKEEYVDDGDPEFETRNCPLDKKNIGHPDVHLTPWRGKFEQLGTDE